MATGEYESNPDQSNVEQISHQDGKDSILRVEDEASEKEVVISAKRVSCSSSEMSLIGYHLPPERLIYGASGSKLIGTKSIAETYVTKSVVNRYGPIVSPTVSPTIPYDTDTSVVKSLTCSQIDFKRARDYEAAASICSMRDSVQTRDAMRVSRISTLFKPSSSVSSENTNTAIKHDIGHQVNGHHTPEKDSATAYQNGSYDSSEYASNDASNQILSGREDTDHSDCDNEDFAMIILPRPDDESHDSATYGCRLPCCSRAGYRTSSPENVAYSPIRVPAKRPGRYPTASPPKSFSESEQNGSFGRHQNGSKSAFTAVSPSRKRHDMSPPYGRKSSVKVRVIQECSVEHERLANGLYETPSSKHIPNDNGLFSKTSTDAIIKSENGGKALVFNRNHFEATNMPKSEEFLFIKSALTKDGLFKKSTEGKKVGENKMLENDVVSPRTASAYLNGMTSAGSLNGYNVMYNITNDNSNNRPMVQCSTVDSTASEADSRLLDLARVANEHLGEELAKQQPISKRVKQKSNDCLHLWEFLRDILNNESMSPKAIEWTVKEKGEFRLIKTGVVAQLWGLSKNRTSMTYEKMARAMRYYYKMKILEKVPHKRLHFRFGKHMLPKVLVLPNGKKE